jgi:ParB family chromosome partitioning protein
MSTRKGLGRGLASLIDDIQPREDAPKTPDRDVPIELIAPNPDQPRKAFDEADLEALTESIRANGVIQPLIVRPDPENPSAFQIVAGERRWRAAQRVPLHALPVIVRDYTEREVLEIGVLENVQRADLNPLEEATAYHRLLTAFGRTQEQIASAMGKSRSHVANSLRLLALPEPVREHLVNGQLTAGHARALITAADPVALCRQVVDKGLSVRETERLAQRAAVMHGGPRRSNRPEKDADTMTLEADLSAAIGLKVTIRHKGEGGEILIVYNDLDTLDGICQKLMS